MADGCFGILFFFSLSIWIVVFILVICLFFLFFVCFIFFVIPDIRLFDGFLCFLVVVFFWLYFVCLFVYELSDSYLSFFLFSIHRDKNDYNPFQLIDNVDHQIIIYTLSIIVIVLYSQVLFWKLILFLVVVYYSQKKKQKTKNEDFLCFNKKHFPLSYLHDISLHKFNCSSSLLLFFFDTEIYTKRHLLQQHRRHEWWKKACPYICLCVCIIQTQILCQHHISFLWLLSNTHITG